MWQVKTTFYLLAHAAVLWYIKSHTIVCSTDRCSFTVEDDHLLQAAVTDVMNALHVWKLSWRGQSVVASCYGWHILRLSADTPSDCCVCLTWNVLIRGTEEMCHVVGLLLSCDIWQSKWYSLWIALWRPGESAALCNQPFSSCCLYRYRDFSSNAFRKWGWKKIEVTEQKIERCGEVCCVVPWDVVHVVFYLLCFVFVKQNNLIHHFTLQPRCLWHYITRKELRRVWMWQPIFCLCGVCSLPMPLIKRWLVSLGSGAWPYV